MWVTGGGGNTKDITTALVLEIRKYINIESCYKRFEY